MNGGHLKNGHHLGFLLTHLIERVDSNEHPAKFHSHTTKWTIILVICNIIKITDGGHLENRVAILKIGWPSWIFMRVMHFSERVESYEHLCQFSWSYNWLNYLFGHLQHHYKCRWWPSWKKGGHLGFSSGLCTILKEWTLMSIYTKFHGHTTDWTRFLVIRNISTCLDGGHLEKYRPKSNQ